MPRITAADIAAASGLSRTTVSLALNDHPRVAAATKEYVREVAARLRHADSDKATLYEILIIVPEGSPDRGDLCTIYLSGMAEAADGCRARCVPIAYTGTETSLWMLDHYLGEKAERKRAVIVAGRSTQRKTLIEKAQATGYPVVALIEAEQPGLSVVRTDERSAAEKAVRFLLQSGATRLAFLGDTTASRYMAERRAGAEQAARKLGANLVTCTVCQGEHNRASLPAPAELIGADGVIAGTPSLARFALDRLQQAGVQIPRQAQLIAFDHSPRAEEVTPTITTVGFDARVAGRLAVDAAVKLLRGDVEQCVMVLPSYICERMSTRPVARKQAEVV